MGDAAYLAFYLIKAFSVAARVLCNSPVFPESFQIFRFFKTLIFLQDLSCKRELFRCAPYRGHCNAVRRNATCRYAVHLWIREASLTYGTAHLCGLCVEKKCIYIHSLVNRHLCCFVGVCDAML